MEDYAIVALYWARDEAAVAESRRKYGRCCYGVAYRILAVREDAEECEGDTYLRAWTSIPPQRPSYLGAFLAKITRNLALDRFRSRQAEKRGGGEAELCLSELSQCLPGGPTVEETADAHALAQSLNAFLSALPQDQRTLFLQRYWYLLPVKEIAARRGARPGAVSTALHRLRLRLRQHLEKEGFAP